MSIYRITSTQGVVLGTYAGATPDDAVAAMGADAGHDGPADPTLIVERVMSDVDGGDYLIELSIKHDRIEHADYTADLASYLSMASEDYAEGADVYEYRGTTSDGDEWRVHLRIMTDAPEYWGNIDEDEETPDRTGEIEATITECGNGLPDVGELVGDGVELYRVVRIRGDYVDGRGHYVRATVEYVGWADCPEDAEVHPSLVTL